MRLAQLLSDLRGQPFYRGQIIRVEDLDPSAPSDIPAETVVRDFPHLPSLTPCLATLGQSRVYRSLHAALGRAFSGEQAVSSDRDVVVVTPPGRARELCWQLVSVLEALDSGGNCLILAEGAEERDRMGGRLADLIHRLDMSYALPMAVLRTPSDAAAAFQGDIPVLIVADPVNLLPLLVEAKADSASDRFLTSLSRVLIPAISGWSSVHASYASVLLRMLHIECLRRGRNPALAATASPSTDLEHYATAFWGKPISSGAFVRQGDDEEAVPLRVVNYGAPMVTDPEDSKRLVREDLAIGAEQLLRWLCGKVTAGGRTELHYVIDVSGSMCDSLPKVGEAIASDVERRLTIEDPKLKPGDLVKVTAFESEAHRVFRQELIAGDSDALAKAFRTAATSLACTGGTDMAKGLGLALADALEERELRELSILLVSDGYTVLDENAKRDLLGDIRALRAQGVGVHLLYVLLDMEPPPETVNFVRELGGEVVSTTADTLRAAATSLDSEDPGKWVVFLAGEHALPESVLGKALGGLRKPVYTRDLAHLPAEVDPRDVHSVVVSGRFPNRHELLQEARNLGQRPLPVFILTEAEAHSRLLIEDWPECESILPGVHLAESNRELLERLLPSWLADDGLDLPVAAYLLAGFERFEGMEKAVRLDTDGAGAGVSPSLHLPSRSFQIREREGRARIVVTGDAGGTRWTNADAFSDHTVEVCGLGITRHLDAAVSPLLLHHTADVEWGRDRAQVYSATNDLNGVPIQISLRLPDGHLRVPMLRLDLRSEQPKTGEHGVFGRAYGEFRFAPLLLTGQITGLRVYERGNLDGEYRDDIFKSGVPFRFTTNGLCWKPLAADARGEVGRNVLAALANLLRVTLRALYRKCGSTLLVAPVEESGEIWVIEIAPGGNGATDLLRRNTHLIDQLLRLSGRLLLDCPCEGGYAGCSDSYKPRVDDNGCPRCSRSIGPVVLGAQGEDLFGQGTKQDALSWLREHGFLPSSADKHLQEKLKGVDDSSRVIGRDEGTRRAFLPWVRRIYADRLGVEADVNAAPGFQWASEDEERTESWVGLYMSGANLIKLRKGMIEWQALDVYAHEFFHALQWSPGILDESLKQGDLPLGGKLFIEGSAVWAESHLADALAIRTSLELNNLREGDEYGEGFRLMKWIEENLGGVPAVLGFLASGDIAQVSSGKITDLPSLYRQAGIIISS